MTALRRYRARVAAAGLVLLAVWEVTVLMNAHWSAPTTGDWRSVAAAVHESAQKNALVVFAPRWIEPVGRLWLGDLVSLDQVARMDAVRFSEVWEVSTRGAAAPEVASETPASELRFGRIRLRRFVRNAPTVTWDLTAQSRIHEVDFEPRKGMLIELDRIDEEGVLTFKNVPLGTELQVNAGLADYRTRYDNRATALLRVMVDGREVSRGSIGNESGWASLPPASTTPGRHDVALLARVLDPRGPVHLELCVAAEARAHTPR